LEFIFPLVVSQQISMASLCDVFSKLEKNQPIPKKEETNTNNTNTNNTNTNNPQVRNLVLAVIDTDSTITYYRLHDGVVPPQDL